MKILLLLVAFLVALSSVAGLEASTLITDLNWEGETSFVVNIQCAETSSLFKAGDIVQATSIACVDANCFSLNFKQFVYEFPCLHSSRHALKLGIDNNFGVFVFGKKKQDVDWVLLQQDYFSKQRTPLISETPEFPLAGMIPPLGYVYLFPIGLLLFIATIVVMRFTKKKIVFPLFLISVAFMIIGLLFK